MILGIVILSVSKIDDIAIATRPKVECFQCGKDKIWISAFTELDIDCGYCVAGNNYSFPLDVKRIAQMTAAVTTRAVMPMTSLG